MIQEYLFIDGTHKAEFEKYRYKTVNIEICDIENSDCWIATCSIDGDNKENANALSVVHEYVMDNYRPTVLSNGCSAYYNKFLYPFFNEFERKLRKLLYLKSALSGDKSDCETIKDLESKDFGTIFALLFSDSQFIQNVKKSVNEKTWQFTKSELLDVLQEISENTLWDKLLGEDAVPSLRSDFVKVKEFRNDVMHAHNMNASSFSAALKLIKKINEQLDVELGKIIVDKNADEPARNGIAFNVAMSNAIRDMDTAKQGKTLQEQLAEIQAAVASPVSPSAIAALDEYKKLTSTLDFSAVQEQLQELSKIQIDIPPALKELQEFTASMEQYKVSLPPAVLELQETLQAFKPDPAVTELTNRLKEILGGTTNG